MPSSSPFALSAGTHWPNMAFIYGPHGMPINSRNRSNTRCASSPHVGFPPRPAPGSSLTLTACDVLLQCLFDRFGSVFP